MRDRNTQRMLSGRRFRHLAILIACAVVLLPWTAYLKATLPASYTTTNWSASWVGFDVMLTMLILVTAVLGLLRRQLVVLTSFGVGVMLFCDAWFDFMTSTAPGDHTGSVLSLLIEIPLAILMIGEAVFLMRWCSRQVQAPHTGGVFSLRIPPASPSALVVRHRSPHQPIAEPAQRDPGD